MLPIRTVKARRLATFKTSLRSLGSEMDGAIATRYDGSRINESQNLGILI